ncbi:hypothetical protein KCM76_04540 [Zooshikella marina]|uniref:hypothetical protein n=1 Tax=Zooshikella ganghwensis TaxID=202772 RepID=UPI000420360B|nr:hypothetical protein [Zooshikella ganghwensis]MBU2705234.1 hypothetical protein [Zooshikella ganghwensis]
MSIIRLIRVITPQKNRQHYNDAVEIMPPITPYLFRFCGTAEQQRTKPDGKATGF